MSYRHLDPDILGMIQELYRRVSSLERTEMQRYTSLRIGNLVLSEFTDITGTYLRITNILTGTVTDVQV